MTATGERYQLTHAKKSSSDPRWSPDSKRLAFLSDRESNQQIYVISPAGGEATQVTHFEGGVTGFDWSPTGRGSRSLRRAAIRKPRRIAKTSYGDFEIVEGDYTMTHLWLINADDEKAKPRRSPPDPISA